MSNDIGQAGAQDQLRLQSNILDKEEARKEAKRKYARERAREKRKDPAYRALELERNRRWVADNKGQALESKRVAGRKWYRANRDQKLAANKAWKLANPEKVREYAKRRRQISSIIKRSDYDSRDYADVLYADPCSYCGERADTVDHIEPKYLGGENHWSNFTAACISCNSSKGTTNLLEFLCR